MKYIKEVEVECDLCEYELVSEDETCPHDPHITKHVLILPDCCANSKEMNYPRVWARRSASGRILTRWYIPTTRDEETDVFCKDGLKQLKILHDGVFYCPFCGEKLPEIVLAADPPQPISNYDDCGHCACGWPRSSGQCGCWPLEAMFEVKNENT